MDSEASAGVGRRHIPARLGIAVLDLVAPGLGLVRLGRARIGLVLLAAQPLFAFLTGLLAMVAPTLNFAAFLVFLVLVFVGLAALFVTAQILNWRSSAMRRPVAWWSRWYVLLLLWILLLPLATGAVWFVHRSYKPFYIASQSMAPTFRPNERVLADMRGGGPLDRGRIVFIDDGRFIRITRIVAIGGDTVEMRDGIPVINGKSAVQITTGVSIRLTESGLESNLSVSKEQLPGEKGTHLVADTGVTGLDSFGPVRVPAGHIFVLGDNRDLSADSRVSHSMMGVGMVGLQNVVGRPLFIHWSPDRSRIGSSQGF